jgi:hypothetical protein
MKKTIVLLVLLLAGVSLFGQQQRYIEIRNSNEVTIAVIDLEHIAAITVDYGTLYIWISGNEHLTLNINEPEKVMTHLEMLLNSYNEAKQKK